MHLYNDAAVARDAELVFNPLAVSFVKLEWFPIDKNGQILDTV